MQKLLPILIVLFVSGFIGCKTQEGKSTTHYEYLQVESLGSEQLSVRIYPADNRSRLKVMVSSYNNNPLDKTIVLQVNESNSDAFEDFYNAYNGQLSLKKSPTEKKIAHPYHVISFVSGNRFYEISNPIFIGRIQQIEKEIKLQLSK